MNINHVGIWTCDIEKLAEYYSKYFGARVGPLYENKKKGFSSRFLEFENSCRIELMRNENINERVDVDKAFVGIAHMAISVGSKNMVDEISKRIQCDGFKIVEGPRTTGDGYYECVVMDPDNNRIEITK